MRLWLHPDQRRAAAQVKERGSTSRPEIYTHHPRKSNKKSIKRRLSRRFRNFTHRPLVVISTNLCGISFRLSHYFPQLSVIDLQKITSHLSVQKYRYFKNCSYFSRLNPSFWVFILLNVYLSTPNSVLLFSMPWDIMRKIPLRRNPKWITTKRSSCTRRRPAS